RRKIERRCEPVFAPPLERIGLSRVADPIFVCPSRRREPGVEALLRRLERRDRDVLGEKGVHPSPQVRCVQRTLRAEVDDLSARVHSGVGAAGTGDPERFAADPAERLLELRLHRRRVGLDLKSGVSGSVIRHARLPVRRVRSRLPSSSSSSSSSCVSSVLSSSSPPLLRPWARASSRRARGAAKAGGGASPSSRPRPPWRHPVTFPPRAAARSPSAWSPR